MNVVRTLILLLCLMLGVGCAAPAPSPPPVPVQPDATASAQEAAPTPVLPTPEPLAATATPALDLAAICPDETEGAARYASPDNGFCMLYPPGLELRADQIRPDTVIHLAGSLADPNAIETVRVNLSIAYNGPADGLDSAQYAATWLERNLPGMDLPQEPATIGGHPAVIVQDLPSMVAQRVAFVVANGHKYQIGLQPQPQNVPQLEQEATLAWETVTQSIVFFPPQAERPVVRAEDVCPAETADTRRVVDQVGGYCLLYPADFESSPTLPGALVGGPELGPFEGFDSVRASLTVGTYDTSGQTLEQLLQPMSDQIDPTSVVSTTIGGHPAVVYDFTGGPWRQRNALIWVDGSIYTFVAQPWDPDRFPQALPDVERIWRTASETIAFFDKWR